MAPVKFDDISKTANAVLSDDYQTSGYQLKAKQKTSWDGAVVTSQVDLFGKDCATPAKLTWKLPAPLGFTKFCVDKLELDKGGKFKLEASSDKAYKDLKLELKSDLVDPSKVTTHATYTGVKDLQLKLDNLAPANPQSFTAEATFNYGIATMGVKCNSASIATPDLGVRLTQGPYFCSLLAKEKFQSYTAHAFYKASNELKCAATYAYGGKSNGQFSLGIVYDIMKGTILKAKVQQDQSISCSVKHEVSKGFTLLGGGKYDTKKGDYTCGLQLSIE